MDKKDNKVGKILIMAVIFLCTLGLGYIAYFGVGPKHTGSFRDISRGLDLAGGVSITYQVVGDETPSNEDMEDTKEKLRNKAQTYSTEAQVYKEGANNDRITVEIPDVTDADAILKELGKPGGLYFISQTDAEGNLNYYYKITVDGELVYCDENFKEFYYIADDMAVLYDDETGTAKLDEEGNTIPFDLTAAEEIDIAYMLLKPIDVLKADGSVILEGANVKNAQATTQENQTTGTKSNVVALAFDDAGTKAFAAATAKAQANGETIAIYYDGNFISVPSVSVVINNGEAVVTGMKDDVEAKRLASRIKIGALKLELEELRSNVVGAQLGSEALSTSVKAAAIGLAIVAVLMIGVYFLPGFASVLALALYTVLMVVVLSIFKDAITLTLPGIAGIILSIGMAVDANVIIYARIREELATGKTLQTSVSIGFKKALSAIIDGNITTLIAAIVLMFFGSGTIKGFGQTLAIGIILSMFTALVISLCYVNGFISLGLNNIKLFGVAKEKKPINFTSKGGIFAVISALVILAGVGFMVFHGVKEGTPLAYSLEFQGGTSTVLELPNEMSIEEIDAQITPEIEQITGDGDVQIQKVENSSEIIIKTRTLNDDERATMSNLLVEQYGVDRATINAETISATISNDMKRESIVAVVISLVCMLLYIWIRFSDFRFGLASIIALAHDVLIVLAFYAVARVSVGSTFIACMLTIVGYSINATIVVFDRIRENTQDEKKRLEGVGSRKRKAKTEDTVLDVKAIVNKSITQTLSRSIFTSLTTFVMVLLLYILGVTSVKEFALPLMIGIAVGTYSSVCLAGNVWLFLRKVFKPGNDDDDEDDLP